LTALELVRDTPIMKGGDDTILSVERAFAVVDMLADTGEGASLADISRRLAVNKGIGVKILDTLEHLGLVWRDDVGQRFYLTYRISNMGLRHIQSAGLLDGCSAVLKSLAETTGELARLAVVEGGQRITWVYAIKGTRRSVQIDPNYSLEIILHAHAIGKAWLSTIPFEQAFRFMQDQGIERRTAYSKTTEEALRSDLADAAARGFASSFQEQELGVGAIAAPIVVTTLAGRRECVGAVSLAAPTSRMNEDELQQCAPRLKETVARLAQIWPLEAGLPRSAMRMA
jgi:IclR family acetate operon transcriptional repressor